MSKLAASHPQPGILLPPPPAARHAEFALKPGATAADARAALQALQESGVRLDGAANVVGLGPSLVSLLGADVPGLRAFPSLVGAGVDVPSTQRALWVWMRGEDRGELLHRWRAIEAGLSTAFTTTSLLDAFVHDGGRDLTGYEDGTENPQGERASEVALVGSEGDAPAGSSFVAVQVWQHDFARFASMTKAQQDLAIGRERGSNEELADGPASAHVKRTAQESFEPEAFVLRRSMPWSDGSSAGLVFVAFGGSLDPFERQLRRMAGLDDGIVDGLFSFTRPVTGSYFWCPPVRGGRIALPTGR